LRYGEMCGSSGIDSEFAADVAFTRHKSIR
jgi:hypothetical protein